eukprot:351505-Chlamydomonas_euryale.AAC.3
MELHVCSAGRSEEASSASASPGRQSMHEGRVSSAHGTCAHTCVCTWLHAIKHACTQSHMCDHARAMRIHV